MRATYTTSAPRQGTKPLAWQSATAGSSAGMTMSVKRSKAVPAWNQATIRARALRPESMLARLLAKSGSASNAAGTARLSQLPLEKRALGAAADGKRRSAGQPERIDVAVDAPELLGVAEPE